MRNEKALRKLLIVISIIITPVCSSYAQRSPAKEKTIPAGSDSNQNENIKNKKRLFDILRDMNKSRGVYFLFSSAAFGERLVDVHPELNNQRISVEKLLNDLLDNTGLVYRKINDQTFVILSPENRKQQAFIAAGTDSLTENLLSAEVKKGQAALNGKVIDCDGQPLPNASVLVQGSLAGTLTSATGFFKLECSQRDKLLVSCIGYQPQELDLADYNNRYLTIQLERTDQPMSEVVVTALGVSRDQKSLGYAMNTLHSQQLTSAGVNSFPEAMYGRVPGLRISSAPGGATSASYVQIRGINSLNFNAQPLYVVDGVVIRNSNEKGSKGINNNGYWDDPRIRGNGVLDINPDDIETLSVLKGASATALYGSEAASGVVVITTRKAEKKEGLGIDFNYTASLERAAFLPKYQNSYGPGYDRSTNLAIGATEEGWIAFDSNGDGVKDAVRPNFNAYAQFGPAMNGEMVPWWNGKHYPFSPQPNNYRDLYRNGYSSAENIAVSNRSDKGAYRFSYTRNDYRGIQVGGYLRKNTFNLNSSFNLSPKLSADLILNFVNSKVHNRPLQMTRILASYTGFFSRAERMDLMFDKYQTSEGFMFVPWNQPQYNPSEALTYAMKDETLRFLWTQLRNSEDEDQNRFFSSFTLNYDINAHLHLRGRLGSDFTSLNIESRQYNEYPVVYNTFPSTGGYGVSTGRYGIIYADALMEYNKALNKNFKLSVHGGYQVRSEKYTDQSSYTVGGLIKENWFSLRNSYGPLNAVNNQTAVFKFAFLGLFNLSYKNFLFLEGTARQEYSSTLPPEKNSYFYPSVNTAFIWSEAFHLPRSISYLKSRASFGIVGNAPPPYVSAITYTQTTLPTINGPVASLNAQDNYGNISIKPENKYETELGLEAGLFKDRLGFDFTWYDSRIVDQVLQMTVPSSTGADSRLVNAGSLRSKGFEASLRWKWMGNEKFHWATVFNFASSSTRVIKLAPGVPRIVYYDAEQSSLRIVAEEGDLVGNIYVYPRLKDAKGNDVIGDDGLYIIDNTRYEKVGNVMPKLLGGIENNFQLGALSIGILIDYRLGGKILSPEQKYNLGAGMYASTLQYRDEAHGGLPYYIDKSGIKILLPSHQSTAPDNRKVYHDGMILPGDELNGQPNQQIVDAAYYYYNMFGWGANSLNDIGSVYNNSYIKLRELVIGIDLPERWISKWHCRKASFSLLGRNLLYFWRTLNNIDPEAPVGSSWVRQSVDEGTMAANSSFGFSLNIRF